MFWRRKSRRPDEQIEWDEDKRSTYRAVPTKEEPVFFYIGDEACLVGDISAGGASFARPPKITEGQVIVVRFRLPYVDKAIRAKFKVIRLTEDTAFGAFVDLGPEGQDLIHRYVLELQKRQVKKRRRRRSDPGR